MLAPAMEWVLEEAIVCRPCPPMRMSHPLSTRPCSLGDGSLLLMLARHPHAAHKHGFPNILFQNDIRTS